MAGFISINPEPFTMRELCLMVEGLQRQGWEQTAAICSLVHNSGRKKKDMKGPDFFNPMVPKERKTEPGVYKTKDFGVLQSILPNVTGDKGVWDALRKQRAEEKKKKEAENGS